jgi:hypothetical protein
MNFNLIIYKYIKQKKKYEHITYEQNLQVASFNESLAKSM